LLKIFSLHFKSSGLTTYLNTWPNSCCQLSLCLCLLFSTQRPHYCRHHQQIKGLICIISIYCVSGISPIEDPLLIIQVSWNFHLATVACVFCHCVYCG
jgi:hypothetical protein